MVEACPFPIAVLSYNRPDYFREVLLSLKNQTAPMAEEQVYLFQDGDVDRFTGVGNAPELKQQSIDLFRQIFPRGRIFDSPLNLGIALNFDRAERFFFETMDHECALFFEDDMRLQPTYLEALIQLAQFALAEPRVSYVAAYGHHLAAPEVQVTQQHELTPLGHKWGFALTRRQWLAQREIVDGYLRIVSQRPYRTRDHVAIARYFAKLGYALGGSSQDAAKDVASLVLGTVKLNTTICLGEYIGQQGTNFTRELFDQGGYARSNVFAGPVPTFRLPSVAELEAISTAQQAQYRARYTSIDPAGLSMTPRMSSAEVELFVETLDGVDSYLEFGAGGSTVLAAAAGVRSIVAVDSDRAWLDKVAAAPEVAGKAVITHLVDLGPVGDWGVPTDRTQAPKWPAYYLSVWDRLSSMPQVVMVDGRFRVATALQALARLGPAAKVMIHDFGDRPHYEPVLAFGNVVTRADTLVVLQLKPDADLTAMLVEATRHAVDFR